MAKKTKSDLQETTNKHGFLRPSEDVKKKMQPITRQEFHDLLQRATSLPSRKHALIGNWITD